jgi:hypothetical protein
MAARAPPCFNRDLIGKADDGPCRLRSSSSQDFKIGGIKRLRDVIRSESTTEQSL